MVYVSFAYSARIQRARLRKLKVQYIFPRAQKQWGGIKFGIDHMVSLYIGVPISLDAPH